MSSEDLRTFARWCAILAACGVVAYVGVLLYATYPQFVTICVTLICLRLGWLASEYFLKRLVAQRREGLEDMEDAEPFRDEWDHDDYDGE